MNNGLIRHRVTTDKIANTWKHIFEIEKTGLAQCAYITSLGMLLQRFENKTSKRFKPNEPDYDIFFFDNIETLKGSAGMGIINNKTEEVLDVEVVFKA